MVQLWKLWTLSKPGKVFFEASILAGQNTWQLAQMNRLDNPSRGLPMDTYFKPSEVDSPNNLAIPGIKSIVIDNLPMIQGDTYLIKVSSESPVTVKASLNGKEPVLWIWAMVCKWLMVPSTP